MDIIHAVLLGMIQGLTEWLPISSSGHLAIAQHFMGQPPLIFDIMLHFGTVLVVMAYFRSDIKDIRKAVGSTFEELRKGKKFKDIVYADPNKRLAWFIVIGIVPTAGIGLLLNFTIIDLLYSSLMMVGSFLILTGVILILTVKVRGRRKIMRMNSEDAWLVGIAQGLAIIPGISRSGSTIGIALLRGIGAETAGRYSFLLSVPAIVGATVIHIPDLFSESLEIDVVAFIIGTIVAMVVGYTSLALLMKMLKAKGFYNFAFYCWIIGVVVLWAGLVGY